MKRFLTNAGIYIDVVNDHKITVSASNGSSIMMSQEDLIDINNIVNKELDQLDNSDICGYSDEYDELDVSDENSQQNAIKEPRNE